LELETLEVEKETFNRERRQRRRRKGVGLRGGTWQGMNPGK